MRTFLRMTLLTLIVCEALFRSASPVIGQAIALLDYDQPVTGQVTADSFRQIYSFTGRAADVINLRLTVTSGSLFPLLILTDNQGNPLAHSEGAGQPLTATIASYSLGNDGTYFVIVTRFGQDNGITIGGFQLLLSRAGMNLNSGPANSPTPLRYGDSLVGTIDASGQQLYTFNAQRGDLISISMQRISGDLDSYLILVDASGKPLVQQDDDPQSPGTLDAAIRNWLIRKSGLYEIVATRFGQAAGTSKGDFTLTLSRVPPEQMGGSFALAMLLDYGTAGSGTIDNNTFTHYFQFDASQGDVIALDVERTRGNLDPTVDLENTKFQPIAHNNQGERGQSAILSYYVVPVAGTYYMVVSRYNGEQGFTAGDFSLTLTGWQGVKLTVNNELQLSYNRPVQSSLGDVHFSQEYVFNGTKGDLVTLDAQVTSGDLQPTLLLEDSARRLLTQTDPSASDAHIDQYKLPASGFYRLVVTRHNRASGTSSGNYSLLVTKS